MFLMTFMQGCTLIPPLVGAPSLDTAALVEEFRAWDQTVHEGRGESDAADSGSLGWGEAPWLRRYWDLYEVTGETYWLDKIIDHFDRAVSHLSDADADGFLSWTTPTYSTALISAAPFHNRGTATISVPQPKLFDGQQAAQVTGHQYHLEFIDAGHLRLTDWTTRTLLQERLDYTPGGEVEGAPFVKVVIDGPAQPGDTFYVQTVAPEPLEYAVHQGQLFYPVSLFIERALTQNLGETYRTKATEYLNLLEKHFLLRHELLWIDTGEDSGAYRFTHCWTERYPNRILPHNQYAALARSWLALAAVSDNPLFGQRGRAMVRNFQKALEPRGEAWVWHYWDWIENGQPDHSGYEDTSHASLNVGLAVEAARRGLFDDATMKRFAQTLLDLMWNGSLENPTIGGRVDTREGDTFILTDWINLCAWEPQVFDVMFALYQRQTAGNDSARLSNLPALLAAQKRLRGPR
jgi:hypothetical protein